MGIKTKGLVPRFAVVDGWDILALESWLIDLAAKGLYFEKCGVCFYWFRRGAPKAVRYRLDAISPAFPAPDADRADHAEEMGWHHVGKLGTYALYLSEDADVPELHTDPVAQSYTLDHLAKKIKKDAIILSLLLSFSIVLTLMGFLLTSWPVLNLVESGASISMIILLLFNFYQIFNFLLSTSRLLTLRKNLRVGIPTNHRAAYRWRARLSMSMLVLSSVFLLFSWYTAYRSITGREQWNITAEAPSPIDFSLSQIETDPNFQYDEFMIQDRNMNRNVQTEWSVLAPVQYDITERGIVPGRFWPGGDQKYEYEPSLTIAYYELTLPFLAAPTLDDLIYRYLDDWGHNTYHREWLTADGFDRLLLAVEENNSTTQELFAQRRNKLIYVRYYGVEDLRDSLPEIAAVLAPSP